MHQPKGKDARKSPVIIYRESFDFNTSNPARVSLNTGMIEVNTKVFNSLPKDTQDWIIRHEKGHYYKQTLNEIEADAYALETSDPKDKLSLWKSIVAVQTVVPKDEERQNATTLLALRIAAQEGNKKAKAILGQTANATGYDTQTNMYSFGMFSLVSVLLVLIILLYKYAK